MTVNEVLYADDRKPEQKKEIRKWLYKIPPFKKYRAKSREEDNKEVPILELERVVTMITRKYAVTLQSIFMTNDEDQDLLYYSASLRSDDGYAHITTVHALNIVELYKKLAIACYALTKGWKGTQSWEGELLTREELLIKKEKQKHD